MLFFLFLFQSLFRIIKPQKVLFLAVDGVAPRAKMNQQRGRRFRSAREAQDLVRKALQKGVILPSEPRFDSNCITPGQCITCQVYVYLQCIISFDRKISDCCFHVVRCDIDTMIDLGISWYTCSWHFIFPRFDYTLVVFSGLENMSVLVIQ